MYGWAASNSRGGVFSAFSYDWVTNARGEELRTLNN